MSHAYRITAVPENVSEAAVQEDTVQTFEKQKSDEIIYVDQPKLEFEDLPPEEKGPEHPEAVQEIIDFETKSGHMTLMHRYKKVTEMF